MTVCPSFQKDLHKVGGSGVSSSIVSAHEKTTI